MNDVVIGGFLVIPTFCGMPVAQNVEIRQHIPNYADASIIFQWIVLGQGYHKTVHSHPNQRQVINETDTVCESAGL